MNLKFRIQKQGFHTLWFWIPLFLTPQFIACAGPVWSTGIIGQHRTPNFALYFQMVIIFLFLVSEKDHKITSTLKRISNHCSYKRLTVAMIVSLSLWGNGYHALADLLSGQASAFKNEDLTRTAALESFGQYQDTTIVIPAYFHTPRSVFIYDISSNPKDWKNEAYTSFYDLKVRGISIRIE
jgi:hypothetical protein